MKAFGFRFRPSRLPRPSRSTPGRTMPGAKENIENAGEIAVGADEPGVNGAYYRVHHFCPAARRPHALCRRGGARTMHIEVGTGSSTQPREPAALAEEAAQLDLLSDGRVAPGVPGIT